jgi:NDP-sugar pyrophosphorylase family protein
MHALVLAAGTGSRLRPLTALRAKPALPVAGQPMIRRIVAWLAKHDAADIVVNLHYLPHTLTAVLGDGSDLSARIRYSWEQPQILGSAGGPRHALPLISESPFLIVNGDVLTDANINELALVHARADALVTLAVVPNREPYRYGGVLLDSQDRVVGFAAAGAAAVGSYHFVGPQLVSADVFRPLPDGQPIRSIGGIYDRLITERPGAIHAFVSDARYWDIGTPFDYLKTSLDYARQEDTGQLSGADAHSSTTVRDSVLWDNVMLGDGCVLEGCIVTDNVRVPAGAAYRHMILMASDSPAPTAFPIETPA